jgi:hypothetical protein
MATKTTITWEQFVAAGFEGRKCEWVDEEIVQTAYFDASKRLVIDGLADFSLDLKELFAI